MSPSVYIQLFLCSLLCSGAISAENATCTNPRAQSNVDMNQVYSDWFVGQVNMPANATLPKTRCFTVSVKKMNESTLEVSMKIHEEIRRHVFSIGNAENAGTWQDINEDRTVQVIYLSADGTTMALACCVENRVEPLCILMSKQLPISSGKKEEVLQAVENAGITGSHCQFTWISEATCPSV
ncbi:uncharacterized protein [Anabrus simplex]|uniref:uncharacterized protein n=1 Tax=Anabrus simplex TaxID=316456 RepID=UPI0035A264F5